MILQPPFSEMAHASSWRREARKQVLLGDFLWKCVIDRAGRVFESEDDLALHVGCFSGALLHWGLAIENAGNAVLVARDPSAPKQPSFGAHKLGVLLSRCGLHLDPASSELADRLTWFLVWAGRYPVARHEDDYLASADKRRAVDPSDQELVHKLITQLTDLSVQQP
jgi:hypothetical protein